MQNPLFPLELEYLIKIGRDKWMTDLLKNGPRTVEYITGRYKFIGMTKREARGLRKHLGIESFVGEDGKRYWQLGK